MTFEEFKKKLEENLQRVTKNTKETLETMKSYKPCLEEYFQENWSIEALTPLMLMNF